MQEYLLSKSIRSNAKSKLLANSATAADAPCELSTNAKPEFGASADAVRAEAVDFRTTG